MADRRGHGVHVRVLVGNRVALPSPERVGQGATKSGLAQRAQGHAEGTGQVMQEDFPRQVGGGEGRGEGGLSLLSSSGPSSP